jgi:hypothetical protein
MRPNPGFDIESAITELGVGEALVSMLDEKGRPGITERALIVPPGSQLGPIDDAARGKLVAASPLAGFYEKAVDRESAYEKLRSRAEAAPADGVERGPAGRKESGDREQPGQAQQGGMVNDILFGRRGPRGGRQTQGLIEAMAKSAARTVGTQAGRALIRGVLGSLLGGRR